MDFDNDIERIALDLIERFGDLAVPVARELTAVSDWSACFVFCAPFSRPLVLTWPLTDCSKRCRMLCLYDNADNQRAQQEGFNHFEVDADHISCKLIEI